MLGADLIYFMANSQVLRCGRLSTPIFTGQDEVCIDRPVDNFKPFYRRKHLKKATSIPGKQPVDLLLLLKKGWSQSIACKCSKYDASDKATGFHQLQYLIDQLRLILRTEPVKSKNIECKRTKTD